MAESLVIRNALAQSKKKLGDLFKELGWSRPATLSEKLAKNQISEEIIQATSRITGIPFSKLKEDVDKEAQRNINLYGDVDPNEIPKNENEEITFLKNELEKKELIIEGLNKEVASKDEIISGNKKLIASLEKRVNELEAKIESYKI